MNLYKMIKLIYMKQKNIYNNKLIYNNKYNKKYNNKNKLYNNITKIYNNNILI